METCLGEDDVCISSMGYGIVLPITQCCFIFDGLKTKKDPLGGIPPMGLFATRICSPPNRQIINP
jgi:hypothetical protein